jgi:S-DNA-T family DNA segregation ATPase FtsK/SpoIIIE
MAGEFLRVVRGPTQGAELRVDEGAELLLGREGEGSGYLGEVAELSRRHAKLTRSTDGGLLVQDLGSLNGTLVNGERITGAHRLAPGDTVKLGEALLVVVDARGRSGQPTAYAASTPTGQDTDPGTGGTSRSRSSVRFDDPQVIGLAVVMLVVAVAVFLLLAA